MNFKKWKNLFHQNVFVVTKKKVMGENCEFYRCCFGYKYSFNNKTNVDSNNIVKFTYVDSKKG